MPLAKNFRELMVYRLARREAGRVFRLTLSFPTEERYSLTDQVRRSSRAVGAMLAEAWGRRRYPLSFAAKIVDALGEATETQAWLDYALDCKYIDESTHRSCDAAWQQVGAMLNKMYEKASEFCDAPRR
jgi:four helix bundle protein